MKIIGKNDDLMVLFGLPEIVLDEIVSIVNMLDEVYGADRNVQENDGGFVVLIESIADLEEAKRYVDYEKRLPEFIEQIGEYVNALYIKNNEFAVNLFIKQELAYKLL